jgi:tetratricopeptide (TPR) repeat protein
MRRAMATVGLGLLVLSVGAAEGAAPPALGPARLTKEQEGELARLQQQIGRAEAVGNFEEAVKASRQVVGLREKWQGKRHWETIGARSDLDYWQRLAKVPAKDRPEVVRASRLNREGMGLLNRGRFRDAEPSLSEALAIRLKWLGEQHPDTANSYNTLALCLGNQGKAGEALPLFRKALAIREKLHGGQHPHTATGYNNMAYCLSSLGKAGEALPLFRKALAIFEKLYGEQHPQTATSYNNVAGCLSSQGKAGEALPLFRKALAIFEKLYGEQHPHTASSYTNVAGCLESLGKPGEALPLHRKALAICEKLHGEEHPHTAIRYNNVAVCLRSQGKAAEAVPLLRKAQAIYEKLYGEQHPDTARSYNNLATCLDSQGKVRDALALHQKALAILEKLYGRQHPHTASSYSNVAGCLESLAKTKEALPLHRKALATFEKLYGEQHPQSANSYDKLALCLHSLGKPKEAWPLFRKALAIREKVLGWHHPDTATSYNHVAGWLQTQGNHAEAVRYWQAALLGFETGRLEASKTGFDRSLFRAGENSPRAELAAALVRLGKPAEAWRHAERDLARGLLEDLLPAQASPADAERFQRLRRLDEAVVPLIARAGLDAEQKKQLAALSQERDGLLDEVAREAARRSRRGVLPLERIQKQIAADAAVVFWLDALDLRLGCVLRHRGPASWVKLPGPGKADARAGDDRTLPDRVLAALADPTTAPAARQKLVEALYRERLAPLERHLGGIRQLLVVPAGSMARVPVEALTDRYTVSYVPSASVYARRHEQHRPLEGGSLLVLADPAFERPREKLPPAPGHGLLVKAVLPGTLASRIRLQAGDVLLEYAGVPLRQADDLAEKGGDDPVPLKLWREGKTLQRRIPPGKLGVVVDRRRVAEALAEWRQEQTRLLASLRGKDWARLPGTRLEAQALAGLVPGATVLLGSQASEQGLNGLAAKGLLKGFRLIHLATHGEANDAVPAETALILARDRLPASVDADARAVLACKKPLDGRLTVQAVLEDWHLDSDLVVLSACQTGLGQYTARDGMLGFTQALLQKGARSVVLSRWKVDDSATALLMVRFYENLLGKRRGTKPLGRAVALKEAKDWLRRLPREEAEKLVASLASGRLRGSLVAVPPVAGDKPPVLPAGDRPYEHPYYWAAFILVGDPD